MAGIGRKMFRAAMWTLLAMFTAGLETYDDARPDGVDRDIIYQDYNSVNTGAYPPDLRGDPIRDLLVFKMLMSLQNRDEAHLRLRERPNFSMIEDIELPHKVVDLDAKESVVKRPSEAVGSLTKLGYKINPVLKPQPKWKSKKGKVVGSQMVCYFKLCAFRSPS